MALVGYAWPPLGTRRVRVLHRGRLPGNKRVLAVVDCVRVGVSQPQVDTASHAAIQRERSSGVVAGRRALEFVDGAELRDRASQRIDAGRPRAIERSAERPGCEGIDSVVTARQLRAGGI